MPKLEDNTHIHARTTGLKRALRPSLKPQRAQGERRCWIGTRETAKAIFSEIICVTVRAASHYGVGIALLEELMVFVVAMTLSSLSGLYSFFLSGLRCRDYSVSCRD